VAVVGALVPARAERIAALLREAGATASVLPEPAND